jgi:hypothetical protein
MRRSFSSTRNIGRRRDRATATMKAAMKVISRASGDTNKTTKVFPTGNSAHTPEIQGKNSMNKTKCLIGLIGFAMCGGLPEYSIYGQPSVAVGVIVPLPSVEVAVPVVEIRAESDFYEPLAPHGEWVVIGSYGRCWRPGHVARDWRPYCNGNWQRTDAGWYWVSDEPWAWATYHYGRWDFTDQYGWYWVPRTQWAPAWVSWHAGGGYVGWAPLQPSVTVSAGGFVGFNESRIPPRGFVFVEQGRFLDPIRPATVVVNNTTIINKTVIVNNTVINEGPAVAVIEKASGRKVEAVPVHALRQKDEAAIVAKPGTRAVIGENKAPAPVSSPAAPRETKTVAAHELPQVEKPAAVTRESAAPVPRNNEAPIEKQKPVPPAPELKPAPAREAIHAPAIKEPTQPRAEKPLKPVKPVDKQVQPPAGDKPATSEKKEPDAANKNNENKVKE